MPRIVTHFLKKGNQALTPQQKSFKLFAIGALLLLGGLSMVIAAHFYVPPSLKQEIITLISLVIAFCGGIMAIIGYVRLLLSRINHFINRS